MNILITGASGFVGQHLVKVLQKDNNNTLFLLVRNPSKIQKQLKIIDASNFKILKYDLASNSIQDLISVLPETLDCVIHLAGIVHAFDIKDFYTINTLATFKLINALKSKYTTKLHFILVSSLAAIGPSQNGNAVDEKTIPSPVSHYGKSKLEAEKILKKDKANNWSYNIIRPSMVIGPNDSAFLSVFKMVKNGIIPLAGRNAKNYTYSFVCVFDLIQAINKLIINDTKTRNQAYFCAHPQTITMYQLLNCIKNCIRPPKFFIISLPIYIIKLLSYILKIIEKFKKTGILITPDKVYELQEASWTCDSTKSQRTIIAYKWNLSQTIKITYNNYCEYYKL